MPAQVDGDRAERLAQSHRERFEYPGAEAVGVEQQQGLAGAAPVERPGAQSVALDEDDLGWVVSHAFGLGGLTRTVPWASATARPSLLSSARTTAVLRVSETIIASATRRPLVTGAR